MGRGGAARKGWHLCREDMGDPAWTTNTPFRGASYSRGWRRFRSRLARSLRCKPKRKRRRRSLLWHIATNLTATRAAMSAAVSSGVEIVARRTAVARKLPARSAPKGIACSGTPATTRTTRSDRHTCTRWRAGPQTGSSCRRHRRRRSACTRRRDTRVRRRARQTDFYVDCAAGAFIRSRAPSVVESIAT